MHNDYLDPDRFFDREDWGYGEILTALKKHNTGRWKYDYIDCSWTGKDADLEVFGNQGCKILCVDDEHVTVEVLAGKTFVGIDVSLNLPDEAETDEIVFNACHEIYMEQAQEVVCGCGSSGEWDGDSWYMTHSGTIKVPVVAKDGEIDADATALDILKESEKSLKNWEREIAIADDILNVLAGWKTGKKLRHCKPGKPGPDSVWGLYKQQQKTKL